MCVRRVRARMCPKYCARERERPECCVRVRVSKHRMRMRGSSVLLARAFPKHCARVSPKLCARACVLSAVCLRARVRLPLAMLRS
jgi:hypothetical protein